MIHENCPLAYRQLGDPQVHCRVIQKIPNVHWTYCKYQYDCRKTGRWEANDNYRKCEIWAKENAQG